jgi:hypothetical protein
LADLSAVAQRAKAEPAIAGKQRRRIILRQNPAYELKIILIGFAVAGGLSAVKSGRGIAQAARRVG